MPPSTSLHLARFVQSYLFTGACKQTSSSAHAVPVNKTGGAALLGLQELHKVICIPLQRAASMVGWREAVAGLECRAP